MTSPLGKTRPDPLGALLKVDFLLFAAPSGIKGLAREAGRSVEVLAVDATTPGKGQFRQFIQECKAHYDTILILEVWNPMLNETLARYGFSPWHGFRAGDFVTGMLWHKPSDR